MGPECANLAIGIAFGEQVISVDVHIRRATPRLGYVNIATPEKTMVELEKILPTWQWLNVNRLPVPFGKHICAGRSPRCSNCPILELCNQAGVTMHR